MTDWRDKFWEVRVFAPIESEFTVTVKAENETDARQEVANIMKDWTTTDLLLADQYDSTWEFDIDQWPVITGEEAFGWKNTPEDLKEANETAWNVECKND